MGDQRMEDHKNQIGTVLNEIMEHIKNNTLEKNLEEVAKNIGKTAEKWKDNVESGYSEFKNSTEEAVKFAGIKIKEGAENIKEGAQNISDEFEEYRKKFDSSGKIRENMQEFTAATKHLFEKMKR